MLVFLAVLYNFVVPYWDTLKKQLAEAKISSLTILHAPNLLTHPIGIALLITFGVFVLPDNPIFYISWLGMIVIGSISLVLNIWGLLKTEFFGAQILGRLGFLTSTLAALFILGEQVTSFQAVALCIATIAVLILAWPKRIEGRKFSWDTGILFIVLSLVIGAFSTILYKVAALHTPNYETFLTGRFVTDLIGWSLVWMFGLLVISRRNPITELKRCVQITRGKTMIIGTAFSSLVSSFLIFSMPVVTFTMLGTITIPAAYFWSQVKYKETISLRLWIGALLSLLAIILFFYPTPA